jgi:CheY-like chemotaxis protein
MKRTILAIDDSKAIRFLIQTVFGKKYQVVTASDGCSAMYWLTKKNLPDLIIADPQLPDMEEWELIEYLKNSGLYGKIPVIVLTNLEKSKFNKTETQKKCEQLGVETNYAKPFNPIELIQVVDKIMKGIKSKEPALTIV